MLNYNKQVYVYFTVPEKKGFSRSILENKFIYKIYQNRIKMKNCNKTVAETLNQMNESRNLLGK